MTPGNSHTTIGGKITIATTLLGVCLIVLGVVVDMPRGNVALANNATTSVTVLNTPPQWDATRYAFEDPASSTSTPTNSGSSVTFFGSSTDSSRDNYYLLICNNYASATAVNGGPPVCGGAGRIIARSASTLSGFAATAATTTYNGDINEFFLWWAYVCDGNVVNASCNPFAFGTSTVATSGERFSPFVVNHRPTFTAFVNDSPTNPGGTVNWYATATDQDNYGGTATDSVRLFVCKAADFTGSACGAAGAWATSPFASATPTSTAVLATPYPDQATSSFGYVLDYHGNFAALGIQGAARTLNISNVTPTITAASISLLDTDGVGNLTLTGVATQTLGFSVRYTVTDLNSCRTSSSTDEVIFGLTDVFRSGITQAGCNQSSMYNANNCYPFGAATTSVNWKVSCVASSTSCLGMSDSDVIWDCTFPLWYVADATDGTGGPATDPPFFGQNWLASAQAGDNNYATSSLVQTSNLTDMTSFLAYNVSTTTIAYGGLQPGNDTVTVGSTALNRTDVLAAGNVGLDETLYGVDMCVGYPAACSGAPTDTIFIANQRYATSSISYATAISLLANPGASFLVHIEKSTTTGFGTQSFKTTHWGIAVPGTITVSGDYLGQNTIIGITSDRTYW